eukprot:364483-Chlamydomonas_euryale.AAC.6
MPGASAQLVLGGSIFAGGGGGQPRPTLTFSKLLDFSDGTEAQAALGRSDELLHSNADDPRLKLSLVFFRCADEPCMQQPPQTCACAFVRACMQMHAGTCRQAHVPRHMHAGT